MTTEQYGNKNFEVFKIYCDKYGFTTDQDLSELNKLLQHNQLEKIHIDIYANNTYMLFLRAIENDVRSRIENSRIIISKNDNNNTSLVNIPVESIDACIIKRYDNARYEIVISIGDILYKIFAIF